MAETPYEGFPATVLQTPDILGSGLRDLTLARQLEASKQPQQPEYKTIDPFETPEYSSMYGNIINSAVNPLRPETLMQELSPEQQTIIATKTFNTPEQGQFLNRFQTTYQGQADFVQALSRDSKEFEKNIAERKQLMSENQDYYTAENEQALNAPLGFVAAIDEATNYGFNPSFVAEQRRGMIPVMGYGLAFLPPEERKMIEDNGPITFVEGDNGEPEPVYSVPYGMAKNLMTANVQLKKGSSLGKLIQTAKVGSEGVTNEKPMEGQAGLYVTSGGRWYPKVNVATAVGNTMFRNFDPSVVSADGTIPEAAFETFEMYGPARRAAEEQGYLDDGEMSAAEKKEFYEKNFTTKERQLSSTSARTLSGTGGITFNFGGKTYAGSYQPMRIDRENMPKGVTQLGKPLEAFTLEWLKDTSQPPKTFSFRNPMTGDYEVSQLRVKRLIKMDDGRIYAEAEGKREEPVFKYFKEEGITPTGLFSPRQGTVLFEVTGGAENTINTMMPTDPDTGERVPFRTLFNWRDVKQTDTKKEGEGGDVSMGEPSQGGETQQEDPLGILE